MKRILLPTDFSATSLNAFVFALDLAHQWGASITTFHAFYPSATKPQLEFPFSVDAPGLVEMDQYRQAAERMHQAAMEAHHAHIPVDHMMEENFAADGILYAAERLGADAVVMGSRGGGGFGNRVLGSTVSSVIGRAAVPVYAVPESYASKPVDRVAFSADLDSVQESDIDRAIDIAAIFGASLTVFGVAHPEDDSLQERAAYWRGRFSDQVAIEVIQHPYIVDGIAEYAASGRVDMLLMKTQRHNFFHQLFRISYSKKMALHSSIPVCLIP